MGKSQDQQRGFKGVIQTYGCTCDDLIQQSYESATDCGGTYSSVFGCPRCVIHRACTATSDCRSPLVCSAKQKICSKFDMRYCYHVVL